jgi:hypothetical protein
MQSSRFGNLGGHDFGGDDDEDVDDDDGDDDVVNDATSVIYNMTLVVGSGNEVSRSRALGEVFDSDYYFCLLRPGFVFAEPHPCGGQTSS